MMDRFPKQRPPLPSKIAEIYAAHYKSNREGRTPASFVAQRMEGWLHRQVARDVVADPRPRTTLEIGAGTLNQLPYEPPVGPYDIVEPFRELYRDSPLLPRVRYIYDDISEIPEGRFYDRITSVATFEHICDLPLVVARAGLLLTEGGALRASIPSEGTPLWTLGWKLTTGLEFRLRHGLDYGLLLRHEHVNTAREVEVVLRHFFGEVRRKVLGLSRSFSLYQFYACNEPKMDECRRLVDERASSH